MVQYALISLIPGLLQRLEDCADPELDSYEKNLVKPMSLRSSDRPFTAFVHGTSPTNLRERKSFRTLHAFTAIRSLGRLWYENLTLSDLPILFFYNRKIAIVIS